MGPPHWKSAVAWLTLLAAQAGAVDLAKIDRSLRKEPVYQSQHPQYCLLVFGPEAPVRAWIVLDGDTLYLDRGANGDLTDPSDRVAPTVKWSGHEDWAGTDVVQREFSLRRPANGPGGLGGEPVFLTLPGVAVFRVTQWVPRDAPRDENDARFWREQPLMVDVVSLADYSQRAEVTFAARPQDAPILHFDGPQRVTLVQEDEPVELCIGVTTSLRAQLTTPGLGATVRTYDVPAKSGHPVAEVECPPRQSGEAPIRIRVQLAEPC
jgi:hypothetical protein